MFKKIVGLCLLGIFVVVAVKGWLESEARIERIANEHDFDAEQTAAFRSCDDHMADKELHFPDLRIAGIPDRVCICHSREMMSVFNNGEYSSHGDLIDYLANDKEGNPLNQTQLREPMSAETGYERLVTSLSRCLSEFYAS